MLLAGALSAALCAPSTAWALPCTRDAQCPPDPKTHEAQVCEETHCQVAHARSIPPFSFFAPGQDGYRVLPLLLYFRTSTPTGRFGLQFPFYFRYDVRSDKPPLRSTTTVLPLLLYSQTTTTAFHNWRVWPLVYHDVFTVPGKDEGYSTTVVPFAYWSNRQHRKWLILPTFLSGGFHDEKLDSTQLTLLLFGYYKRAKDDVWRVLFPLFFDHQDKNSRRVLAPLFYYKRDQAQRTTVVFPFVYDNHDRTRDHTTVLPLFDYDQTRDKKQAHVLTLLGGWQHDRAAGTSSWYATVPPIYHYADPKRTIDIAAPLYAHWKANDEHSSGFLLFPFVRHATPQGSVNTFAGLFWHLTDTASGGATTFLFPVAGFHHHPGAAGGFVGPLYAWGSHNTGNWGAGVFPLAFFGRNKLPGGTRRHAFLFPLFEHASDDATGTSTTVVGPGFFHREAGGRGWDAGVAPLLYFGKRAAGGGYAGLLPLFFHSKTVQADGVHNFNLVGPVFCNARPDGYTSGVFPLAFFNQSQRGQGAAASGYQVLFPLFFRFTNGERPDGHGGMTPQIERVASLLFFRQRKGDNATSVLFPLFYLHQTPERTTFISPLLTGYSRDEAKQTRTLMVGPWFSHVDDRNQTATRLLFPLAISYRSPKYAVTTVLPPIFWRVRDGEERDTVLFPFYWRVRSPGYNADVVFPLGGHSHSADASMTVVGTFWTRTATNNRRSIGLFPLFGYYRAATPSWSILATPLGFYQHDDTTQRSRFIFGAAFSFSSPAARTSGLFPLIWNWRRGSATSTLLPFIFHRSDPAQDDSITVLGPVYFGHHEHERSVGVLPLFYRKSTDEGSRNLFLPLFYYGGRKDGSTMATLLFGWATHPDDRMFYVGLFSYRHVQNTRAAGFWPLIYFSHDTVSGATTRLVLPLYFHKQFADGNTVSAFTPIIWHFRSVERATTIGFPLFFDDHLYAESRTTGVLPFVFRKHSEIDDHTNWVFPPLLLWVRTRPVDHASDFMVFPLVFHFGQHAGEDPRATTIGFPVYWDIIRGDSRTVVAFPVAYYWRRETAENWLVLNTFYTRGRGVAAGSWHFHFIPLFDVGRPHPHDIDWSVLYGLFGYKRIGRNRTLKLFWLFDAELQPANKSTTMSWFGQTPPSERTTF